MHGNSFRSLRENKISDLYAQHFKMGGSLKDEIRKTQLEAMKTVIIE